MVDTNALANSINSVVNQSDISSLPARITQAIKNAAARTGVDFSYLMKKASQESGFDPNAKASSSSATGLFQFTNQTWLQMIKQHGADYGLGAYADNIQIDGSGSAHVNNPVLKQAILDLRKDPQISAEMAGELDKTNLVALQDNVGGKIGATDLYMAHFLGAGGASDFLNAMKSNPNAKAAEVLPDAAAANPSVFYASNGQPRSLSQIYQHFAEKFNGDVTTVVANAQTQVQTNSAVSRIANASAPTALQVANSYVVAANISSSNATTTVASNDAYTAPVNSNIKVNTSSLVNTMLLAQMNLGDMAADMDLNGLTTQNQNKKNLMAALSGVA